MLILWFCLAFGMLNCFLLLLVRIGAKPIPTPPERFVIFRIAVWEKSSRLHLN